jgi:hypothetical protein
MSGIFAHFPVVKAEKEVRKGVKKDTKEVDKEAKKLQSVVKDTGYVVGAITLGAASTTPAAKTQTSNYANVKPIPFSKVNLPESRRKEIEEKVAAHNAKRKADAMAAAVAASLEDEEKRKKEAAAKEVATTDASMFNGVSPIKNDLDYAKVATSPPRSPTNTTFDPSANIKVTTKKDKSKSSRSTSNSSGSSGPKSDETATTANTVATTASNGKTKTNMGFPRGPDKALEEPDLKIKLPWLAAKKTHEDAVVDKTEPTSDPTEPTMENAVITEQPGESKASKNKRKKEARKLLEKQKKEAAAVEMAALEKAIKEAANAKKPSPPETKAAEVRPKEPEPVTFAKSRKNPSKVCGPVFNNPLDANTLQNVDKKDKAAAIQAAIATLEAREAEQNVAERARLQALVDTHEAKKNKDAEAKLTADKTARKAEFLTKPFVPQVFTPELPKEHVSKFDPTAWGTLNTTFGPTSPQERPTFVAPPVRLSRPSTPEPPAPTPPSSEKKLKIDTEEAMESKTPSGSEPGSPKSDSSFLSGLSATSKFGLGKSFTEFPTNAPEPLYSSAFLKNFFSEPADCSPSPQRSILTPKSRRSTGSSVKEETPVDEPSTTFNPLQTDNDVVMIDTPEHTDDEQPTGNEEESGVPEAIVSIETEIPMIVANDDTVENSTISLVHEQPETEETPIHVEEEASSDCTASDEIDTAIAKQQPLIISDTPAIDQMELTVQGTSESPVTDDVEIIEDSIHRGSDADDKIQPEIQEEFRVVLEVDADEAMEPEALEDDDTTPENIAMPLQDDGEVSLLTQSMDELPIEIPIEEVSSTDEEQKLPTQDQTSTILPEFESGLNSKLARLATMVSLAEIRLVAQEAPYAASASVPLTTEDFEVEEPCTTKELEEEVPPIAEDTVRGQVEEVGAVVAAPEEPLMILRMPNSDPAHLTAMIELHRAGDYYHRYQENLKIETALQVVEHTRPTEVMHMKEVEVASCTGSDIGRSEEASHTFATTCVSASGGNDESTEDVPSAPPIIVETTIPEATEPVDTSVSASSVILDAAVTTVPMFETGPTSITKTTAGFEENATTSQDTAIPSPSAHMTEDEMEAAELTTFVGGMSMKDFLDLIYQYTDEDGKVSLHQVYEAFAQASNKAKAADGTFASMAKDSWKTHTQVLSSRIDLGTSPTQDQVFYMNNILLGTTSLANFIGLLDHDEDWSTDEDKVFDAFVAAAKQEQATKARFGRRRARNAKSSASSTSV